MITTNTQAFYGEMNFNLDYAIDLAEKSKQSFINFIKQIKLHTVKPWIIGRLEEFWTDAMSQSFFNMFWNGSLDVVTIYTPREELPSIIDDIDRCIATMTA
ncbi:hypothetical protein BSK66_26655 [Paenibacillus odorifer]|uniref:hypothetical protein n=1 Tax=Paenibacillus TaxID=44249 RepID=UPI0003E299A6|nr:MULTISPECIES: hypothetical protein [Paenibacillus]ETT49329.1 hypothetical protein C171_23690 [Paenibacillus sp. FSL H8-237]OME49541.1 hypothetical protein BSK66_26655 [Paenibacillus odorifer]